MAEARILALLVTAFVCSACGATPTRSDERASAAPGEGTEVPVQAADAQASAEPQPKSQAEPASGSATASSANVNWPRHLQPIDEREAAIARAMRSDFGKYDTDNSGGLNAAEFAKLEEDVLAGQQDTAPVPTADPDNVPLRRDIVTSHAGRPAPQRSAPASAPTTSDEAAVDEEEESPQQMHSRPRAEYARPMN